MRYQAVIFDMDGTISDSEQLWAQATDTFLVNNNILLQKEERVDLLKQIQGTTHEDATVYMKDRFKLSSTLESLMTQYAQYAHALIETEVQFIDGFLAFYVELDKHNLKYGIATNADNLTLSAIKKALALESLFGSHIYNGDHVNQQGKPKPDIYLHAAQALNVSPYVCIAIEDSACGIKSAKAANMFCIGINSHGDVSQLEEADMIIDSYHEIDLSKLLMHSS